MSVGLRVICVDSTFLVDLWREKDQPNSSSWAVEHASPLATRNVKHFKRIRGLQLIDH